MKWQGFAAVLTGIAGCITAYAAVIRARNEGRAHCRDELNEARTEAEHLATELHAARMRGEAGVASVLFLVTVVLFGACVAFTALAVSGNDGARGERGERGEQGVPGAQGQPGRDGRDGRDGASVVGPTGATGRAGSTGATGAEGAPGEQGQPGVQGAPGEPAPPTSAPTTLQCPEGFAPVTINVHQRSPNDVDREVMVCAAM